LKDEDNQLPDFTCFIEANGETTEKLLTSKRKSQAHNLDLRVVRVRIDVEETYKRCRMISSKKR